MNVTIPWKPKPWFFINCTKYENLSTNMQKVINANVSLNISKSLSLTGVGSGDIVGVIGGIVVVIYGIDVVVDGVVVVTDAIIYIYIYYIISAILANNPNSVIIDISAIIKNIS